MADMSYFIKAWEKLWKKTGTNQAAKVSLCLSLFYKSLSDQILHDMRQQLGSDCAQFASLLEQYQADYYHAETGQNFRKQLRARQGFTLAPNLLWPSLSTALQPNFKRLVASHPVFGQIFEPFLPTLHPEFLTQAFELFQGQCLPYQSLLDLGLLSYFELVPQAKPTSLPQVRELAQLLQNLVTFHQKTSKSLTLYDAKMKHALHFERLELDKFSQRRPNYYGQTSEPEILAFALMQLILKGEDPRCYHFYVSDVLKSVWPMSGTLRFDGIFLQLDAAQSWEADRSFLTAQPLAPKGLKPSKSKAEWAYVMAAFERLKQGGRMVAVVPQASLARGYKEAAIRLTLLQMGVVDAVIQLPKRLTKQAVPMVALVLRREESQQPVFFLDGAALETGEAIFQAYAKRRATKGISALIKPENLCQQAANLLVAKYVDMTVVTQAVASSDLTGKLTARKNQLQVEKQELLQLLADLKEN